MLNFIPDSQNLDTSQIKLRCAVNGIRRGAILAYPTEAVFGLGCDPVNETAVHRLLELKKRPVSKGLIMIASDFDQLLPFVELSGIDDLAKIMKTWPGPVTWLFPAQKWVPRYLRGNHDTIAVRVSAHPVASALCELFGKPLVSTSANPAGRQPALNPLKIRQYFRNAGLLFVSGDVGPEIQVSRIFSAIDNTQLR